MPVFDARDIISWAPGDNSTDTVIGDIHFNLTALEHWNFTLYSNGTLSNGSRCLLTFGDYTPKYVFPNGTFLNTTSCYSPIMPISARGYISIGLSVVYGLALVFTLICLKKHGSMFLPTEKRFRPVGRRWQWYWMVAMCATGFISLVTNIDVDRYYLPEIPIVLTSFFWFLMNLCTMAAVWEAVRHWGSWQERQYIDPDPFRLKMDDKRAKFEFWVPLFFYLWWWLDFFMGIPRNWGSLELQRSPEQTRLRAAPGATDNRLKAAAFLLLMCWLTIVYYLRHAIKHYKERNRGIFNRAIGFVKFTPYRFMLILPLALSVVAYQALSAWEFQYSVMDITGDNVATFVGGYVPALLILFVQIIAGFLNPNEDRELIRQRRIRGAQADHELGVVRKPAWWRRVNGKCATARPCASELHGMCARSAEAEPRPRTSMRCMRFAQERQIRPMPRQISRQAKSNGRPPMPAVSMQHDRHQASPPTPAAMIAADQNMPCRPLRACSSPTPVMRRASLTA